MKVMSVFAQPPSDQLLQLKLFLEKLKSDFSRENSDLAGWMSERAIRPELFSRVVEKKTTETYSTTEQVILDAVADRSRTDAVLATSISEEEFHSIIAKMNRVLDLPPGKLEAQSALYLEQQLSDILGFEVTTQLENQELLYTSGTVAAEPHLRRTTTDTLQDHTHIHAAGLSKHRSFFGWFSGLPTLTDQAIMREQYYISVPLYSWPDWTENQHHLRKWYAFRKVVVCNPAEHRAVVAVVGNASATMQNRYQFGASSEVIRQGRLWSSKARGRVIVFFVDDPQDLVPLGPIQLDALFQASEVEVAR